MKRNEDDCTLLAHCRQGDEQAFATLMQRYQQRVLRLAFHLLGDRAEAEDVAQETFIQLFRTLPTFRGEASLFTWLYRVTVHLCRRRQRQHPPWITRPLAEAGESSAPDSVEAWVERRERQQQVRTAVAGLPEKYRLVVILFYFHDLSLREIARLLRIPAGTVKWRLHAARQQLEQRLREVWGEETDGPAQQEP